MSARNFVVYVNNIDNKRMCFLLMSDRNFVSFMLCIYVNSYAFVKNNIIETQIV